MRSSRMMWAVSCTVVMAAWGPVFAADPANKDVLKDRGLARSGNAYVLADEAAVLEGVKALRATKADADKETRARQVIDSNLAAKRKIIKDSDKQWHELETRLTLVTKPETHNAIVLRMNRLVADQKAAAEAAKDLEEQAGKVPATAKTKFVDDAAALNARADAVTETYHALADDPAVKAALAKVNGAALNKVALGPSPEFAAAVGELKKWQAGIESEAIPMHEEHGIHTVDVLLNGEHFVMGVDTGASSVSLPGEVAEKLKMVPGENDPTVQIKLADGSVIEGKQMSIKSVRVGRFTVEDVTCLVLQKGLPDPPVLLGGSFLNHFVVKLDPAANALHLTEIQAEGQPKTSSAGTPAKPASTPPTAGAGNGGKADR